MLNRAHLLLLCSMAGCGNNQTAVGGDGAAARLDCLPDLDGRIEAREAAPGFGVAARYAVGQGRSVDLAGRVDAAGRRSWDFTAPPADPVAALTARRLTDQWYAASFPTAGFAAPLDLGGALDGIYSHDERALWLHGYASSAPSPPEGRTLVVYAQPVALLRFPLEVGARWSATGEVPASAGTVRGLPWVGRDSYAIEVDGAGRLLLPEVTFTQVLRVRTSVTVTPAAGPALMRRQVGFLFECFGEVARATSRDGEAAADFTTAAELRRLTF